MTQLKTANFKDWKIDKSWQYLVNNFFESNEGKKLLKFLQERLNQNEIIFPPQPLRALELTPVKNIRAIILGQDPYHQRGQAEGLAFSVAEGTKIPPSLQNIFKEIKRDLNKEIPKSGSLISWAKNGVLLLNTCLTVEENLANSHSGKGWELLTDKIISFVANQEKPIVFMLWGKNAQTKKSLIPLNKGHLILESNHPSPLSALKTPNPFIGNGHFSQAKKFLDK